MEGSIQYFRKNGEPGSLYPLTVGNTTIGGSFDLADVRIKINHPHLEDIHCVLEVNADGVATLVNRSNRAPVAVNDIPVKHAKVLHHGDKFDVIGKLFRYVNPYENTKEIEKLESRIKNVSMTPSKSERRSAMPSLKTKSTPKKSPVISTKIPAKIMPQNRSLSLSLRNTPKVLYARKSISGPLTSRVSTPKVSKTPKTKEDSWDVIPTNESEIKVSVSSCKTSVASPKTTTPIKTRKSVYNSSITPAGMESILEEANDEVDVTANTHSSFASCLTSNESVQTLKQAPSLRESPDIKHTAPFRLSKRKPIHTNLESPDSTTTEGTPVLSPKLSPKVSAIIPVSKTPGSSRKSFRLQESDADSPNTSEMISDMFLSDADKDSSELLLVETQTTKSVTKRMTRNSVPNYSTETVTKETYASKSFSSFCTSPNKSGVNKSDNLDQFYNEVFNITEDNTFGTISMLKSDNESESDFDLSLECSTVSSGDAKRGRNSKNSINSRQSLHTRQIKSFSAQHNLTNLSNISESFNKTSDKIIPGSQEKVTKERGSRQSRPIDDSVTDLEPTEENINVIESSLRRSRKRGNLSVQNISRSSNKSNSLIIGSSDKTIDNFEHGDITENERFDNLHKNKSIDYGKRVSQRSLRQLSPNKHELTVEEKINISSRRNSKQSLQPDSTKDETKLLDSLSDNDETKEIDNESTRRSSRITRNSSLITRSSSATQLDNSTSADILLDSPTNSLSSRSSTRISKLVSIDYEPGSVESTKKFKSENYSPIFNPTRRNLSVSKKSLPVSSLKTVKTLSSQSFSSYTYSPKRSVGQNIIHVSSTEGGSEEIQKSSIAASEFDGSDDVFEQEELNSINRTGRRSSTRLSSLNISNSVNTEPIILKESTTLTKSFTFSPTAKIEMISEVCAVENPILNTIKRRSSTRKSLISTPDKSIPALRCSTVNRESLGNDDLENVFTPPDNPKPSPVLRKSVRKIVVPAKFDDAQNTPGLRSLIRRSSAAEVMESNTPDESVESANCEIETPKSALKPRRSKSLYNPPTENVTPVTPVRTDNVEAFKTPVNTPGLFENIKKSVMRSRKRRRESGQSVIKESKKMKMEADDSNLNAEMDDSMDVNVSMSSASSGVVNSKNIRKILDKIENSPKNDLTDVRGVKKLLATPREIKSPENNLCNVAGVKKLFSTPKLHVSPTNDLTKVPNLRRLMSPKIQNSPRNDLTKVPNLRKLMSPKSEHSPKNDLTKVPNLRRLMSPKIQNSPKNDLTKVPNLRGVLSPKVQKSPKNDLTEVPNLRRVMSPRNQISPKNDLTSPKGLKKLMATPKVQKEPVNDLSDVEGVASLFNVSGVEVLNQGSDIENCESLFDKLAGRPHLRAYGRTSLTPKKDESSFGGRRKTIGDVPEMSPRVEKWVEEQSKLMVNEDTEVFETVTSTTTETVSNKRKFEDIPSKVKNKLRRSKSADEVEIEAPRTRGRKPRKVAEVHTEKPLDLAQQITEDVQPASKQPKPRRAQKAITKVETPESPQTLDLKKVEIKVVDINAKKPPRRGRKAVSVEDESQQTGKEVTEAKDDIEIVDLNVKNQIKKGRKNAKGTDVEVSEATDEVVVKGKQNTRRGRAKQIEKEIVENVEPQEEIIETTKRGRSKKAEPVPVQQNEMNENMQAEPTRSLRGRKAKIEVPVEENKLNEDVKGKVTRARKGRKEITSKLEVPVEENMVDDDIEVNSRTRRGVSVEEPIQEEIKPKSTRGRGKKQKEITEEPTEVTEISEDAEIEFKPRTRGRGVKDEKSTQEQQIAETKPKRGRARGKKANEIAEEIEDTEASQSNDKVGESEVKSSTKARRGKKLEPSEPLEVQKSRNARKDPVLEQVDIVIDVDSPRTLRSRRGVTTKYDEYLTPEKPKRLKHVTFKEPVDDTSLAATKGARKSKRTKK